jgi:glycosyltransferase involved in cell wall biosynthesis
MRVSVIATVYNERHSIQRLLDSLAAQTRPPDEVMICDGGSTDGTAQIVEEYARQQAHKLPNVRLIVAPGANISRGRNLAIEAAAGPLIAATDAGVRLECTWLAKLIAPWDVALAATTKLPIAAAGFFVPDVEGVFQTAMAATVLPLASEIDPNRFLPSSRSVAFTKEAWARAGGYPEWLDYCEDLLFDFAINEQRPDQPTAFVWAPEAIVHFRPRTSLGQFWQQYYHYARGDGKADLWRKRHVIRYATYLVVLPALLGHAFFGFYARWLGWLGFVVGIAVYCQRPWQRLATLGHGLSPGQRLAAAALVPLMRVVGDVAKMAGYPVGIRWRIKNKGKYPV